MTGAPSSGRRRATRSPRIGLALAGGGPLGAMYEIGALAALAESLDGIDFNDLDVYVGVSAGAVIAAGLANGLSPSAMCRMFVDSKSAVVPFEPAKLLEPALGEYGRRLASLPRLMWESLGDYLSDPLRQDPLAAFARLARALPAGVFDNQGLGELIQRLFQAHGRADDFRALPNKLFLVATDLDSGESVAFGSAKHDHVLISRAVQASAALPGLYPPVCIDGRWYVDGALKKTMHASVALEHGAELVICVNPLVPYDAQRAAQRGGHGERRLVDGGLPLVLAQTFRAIIHSRMVAGISKYAHEYKGADVLLFEPSPDDDDMFFTNMFSYAGRHRLSEHAYHKTREDLLARADDLAPRLARHGIGIRRDVLEDPGRTLRRAMGALDRSRAGLMGRSALSLSDTLDALDRALDRMRAARAAS